MIKISELLKIKLPFVLASKSPRRKKLLEQLGFEFSVIESRFDEKAFTGKLLPFDFAKELAYLKAKCVADELDYDAIVIGADTIVVLDDEILHKPKDEKDAYSMLKKLSGRTHIVFTGIAIINTNNQKVVKKTQKTNVSFRELDDDEIYAYIRTGSPMDKAGSYGIQDDFGAVFVNYIEGCYYNIVGLPLEMLYTSLKEAV